MTIPVTCPSCFKRFNVSEKFAGKSGPCPSCQKTIKIPDKSEQVVIHAPEEAGPKDSKGQAVLKPIRRREVALSLPVLLGAGLGTLVVFGIALGMGLSGDPPTWLLATSSILLALPLSLVGYWFLHDDELEGYKGRPLWIRCGIASLVFAATWGIYTFVPAYLSDDYRTTADISGLQMMIFIVIMIALGMTASILIFELEFVQGLLHYMLYFVLTFILAWMAGVPLAEPLSGEAQSPRMIPPATSPRQVVPEQAPTQETPAPAEQEDRKVPNILQ